VWPKLKRLRWTLTLIALLGLFCFPGKTAANVPVNVQEHRCGAAEPGPVTLSRPYQSGADVLSLQRCLFNLGFYKGTPDGYYGINTLNALISFQKKHNLPPTGVIDSATWAAISEDMVKQADTISGPSEFYDVVLLVDTFNLTLTVFSNGEPVQKYPVAVGKPGSETPVGVWKIINKSSVPAPGTGTHWMGLNVPCGNYGVHGTNNPWSIGTYASGGCVRLHNAHIKEIYDWTPEGAWVIITGNPFGRFGEEHPLLQQGDCSPAVREVQYKLKRLGFYKDEPDSIFGAGTARAVQEFRRANGLSDEARVDEDVYHLLAL
jgi:L,D-transpeptidase ErfK/SrfK